MSKGFPKLQFNSRPVRSERNEKPAREVNRTVELGSVGEGGEAPFVFAGHSTGGSSSLTSIRVATGAA